MTDNRDESINRPAVFPQVYHEYETQLFYPKDKKAGGTWFGVSHHRQLICLMNGAFSRHKRQKVYRKSRGLVVKELVSSSSIHKAISDYNFEGIEAFFAIVISWNENLNVFELVWDGQKVYINEKDETKPNIWSSSMTYTKAQRDIREKEFQEFMTQSNIKISAEAIWKYHHRKGEGKEDIIIDRGVLKTTSIFQITNDSTGQQSFHYEDLMKQKEESGLISWNS